ILALGYAADARNLLRDLPARQHAALAGLRALRQLDLERLHVGSELLQLLRRQAAVEIAHAVLRRAHLHDDVATALHVIGREPALAGVHPAARELRAAREGTHGRRGDRAEAHTAYVDDGMSLEGIAAPARADGKRRRRQALFLQHREGMVDEDDRTRLPQV